MGIVRRSVPIPAPHVYAHRLEELWRTVSNGHDEESKRRWHIEALRVLRDLVKEMKLPPSSFQVRSRFGEKWELGDAMMTCEFVRVVIQGVQADDHTQVVFQSMTSKNAVFGGPENRVSLKQFTRLKEFAALLNRYNRRNV